MQSITEKIRRLQALAGSDNVHEAATAARIAEQLKAKYPRKPRKAPLREPPVTGPMRTVKRRGVRTAVFAGQNPLEYSPRTDSRIVDVIDGKVFVNSVEDAEFLASEMRVFGIRQARAFGFAVVFWG